MSASGTFRELKFKQFDPSTCPAVSLLLRGGTGGRRGRGCGGQPAALSLTSTRSICCLFLALDFPQLVTVSLTLAGEWKAKVRASSFHQKMLNRVF